MTTKKKENESILQVYDQSRAYLLFVAGLLA